MKRVLPPLPAKPKVRTVLLESLNPSTDSGPSSAWGPPGYFELLKGHALCDCVLRTDDGGVFKAHRVRLCSLSRFFLVLYTHSFNREPPRDVRLRGVKTNTLMQLLIYCYMGQVRRQMRLDHLQKSQHPVLGTISRPLGAMTGWQVPDIAHTFDHGASSSGSFGLGCRCLFFDPVISSWRTNSFAG